MRRTLLPACFVTTLALVAACSSDADAPDGGAGTSGGAGSAGTSGDAGTGGEAGATESFELRTLTYNTALAPDFEPFASERVKPVVDALAAAAAQLDLLCVQEFWLGSDLDALVSATASELPNVVRRAPEPGSGDCSADELGSLGGCLQTSCPSLGGVELVGCAQQACATEIGSLSGGCLGCIINNLDADFTSCLGDSAPDDPAIFGGDYDVGLLSRYPLLETESKKLDAYFVRTAVLYAKLDVPGLGPVHAFCTHLGSSLGVIPYQGPYAGWDDEHAHQVSELLAYIQSKAIDSAPLVLLGDLNMGPALGSSLATLPDQYQELLAAGLSDPYASQPNALCTDCADDTFNQMFPGYQDTLIDHVLVRGLPTHVATSQRVFESKTSIAGQDSNLSDHYGLRVVLETPNTTTLASETCGRIAQIAADLGCPGFDGTQTAVASCVAQAAQLLPQCTQAYAAVAACIGSQPASASHCNPSDPGALTIDGNPCNPSLLALGQCQANP